MGAPENERTQKIARDNEISERERGDVTWQIRLGDDHWAGADTIPVKHLPETVVLSVEGGNPVPGMDPYSSATSPNRFKREKRRTLDDMRRLSAQIRRAKP